MTLELLTELVGKNQIDWLMNIGGNEDQVERFLSLLFLITNVFFSFKIST